MTDEYHLPPIPQQALHFFTQVDFNLLPEIDYHSLVELCQLEKYNNRGSEYDLLPQVLQKIQWAKVSGTRAKSLDAETTAIAEQRGSLIYNEVTFVEYGKSIFEVITYTKAALDTLAHFLNDHYRLKVREQTADFKWAVFRGKLNTADSELGRVVQSLELWLDKDRKMADNVIAVRDEWIHRGVPNIALQSPPNQLSSFPIPKAIGSNRLRPGHATPNDFYSTAEFVDLHMGNLVRLFSAVIQRCIVRERHDAPHLHVERRTDTFTFWPVVGTINIGATYDIAWMSLQRGPIILNEAQPEQTDEGSG